MFKKMGNIVYWFKTNRRAKWLAVLVFFLGIAATVVYKRINIHRCQGISQTPDIRDLSGKWQEGISIWNMSPSGEFTFEESAFKLKGHWIMEGSLLKFTIDDNHEVWSYIICDCGGDEFVTRFISSSEDYGHNNYLKQDRHDNTTFKRIED